MNIVPSLLACRSSITRVVKCLEGFTFQGRHIEITNAMDYASKYVYLEEFAMKEPCKEKPARIHFNLMIAAVRFMRGLENAFRYLLHDYTWETSFRL